MITRNLAGNMTIEDGIKSNATKGAGVVM